MSHAFTQPDHVEVELSAAEAAAEWFDEWMDQWFSDQSDEGYKIALAEIERRELQMCGVPSDSHSNAREAVL